MEINNLKVVQICTSEETNSLKITIKLNNGSMASLLAKSFKSMEFIF